MSIGRRITKIEDYRGKHAAGDALCGFVYADETGRERAEVCDAKTGAVMDMDEYDARYPQRQPYLVLYGVNPHLV